MTKKHGKLIQAAMLCFPVVFAVTNCVVAQETAEDSLDALLESKVETASKYEQTVSEAPASITIITRQDINIYGYKSLAEVLNSIPGFYISNDRNYSYVGVRGFSRPTDFNNRTLLLLNGIPLNENHYGAAFVETVLGIDMKMIDRVEIVRGPNSALYGIGAMLGVINIITRKTDSLAGFEMEGNIGSYNSYGTAARYGKEFEDGSMFVASGLWGDSDGEDLYFPEFDDPSTNDGVAEDLDWDRFYNFYSMFKKGGFSVQTSAANREKGIPTASYLTAFNDPGTMTSDGRFLIDALFQKDLDSTKQVMFRGYYQHYHYTGNYPEDPEILFFDENRGNWFGGQFQYLWDFRTDNRLIAGAEFTSNPTADYYSTYGGELYYARDYSYSTVSFYVQDEYQIMPSLSLTAGLRHDHYSNGGSATSPRAAVIYHPFSETTFKLLYGKGFRAPNVYERTFAVEPYVVNPDIKPETINTFEIVAEQKFNRHIFASASLYRIKIKNLIDTLENPEDGSLFFGNTEEAHTDGFELQMQSRFVNQLQMYASFSYQWAHNSITEEHLTNSPHRLVKGGFSAPLGNLTTAGAELLYESKRQTVYGTDTDSFWITNVNVKGKFPELLGLEKMHWALKVENLFDVEYYTPGGFEHRQAAIIQPGRRFALEIGYEF